MVQVTLWGSIKAAAGGTGQVEVEASNIRQLLDALRAQHPGLEEVIERGVAVSVDGEIHQDAWFVPITPESEVFVLPHMEGG